MDDNWTYAPDAEITRRLLSDPSLRPRTAPETDTSQLCSRCVTLPIWLPRHTFTDTLSDLRERSPQCELCRLLLKHVEGYVTSDKEAIHFFRVGSFLTLSDRKALPILSIYITPNQRALSTYRFPPKLGYSQATSQSIHDPFPDLHLGHPRLPEPGSTAHIKVLQEWIFQCNIHHQCSPNIETFLPTRVLELASPSKVRLFCGTRGQTCPGKYLALSHRWGSSIQHKKFCTNKANITQNQRGIEIADLPKTFQDAIQITRKLGIQFLWIDSLCIIQDDKEDWKTESRLMEQVFSSAYATIAASCARGTSDGFLKPRPFGDCVTMKDEKGSSYYICDSINDFSRDVDRGELNQRGWVLQERALSRRTIYFAEMQTYWECGDGVRCETLTKMNKYDQVALPDPSQLSNLISYSKKASFLGDANFPNSIKSYVKGKKIQLFQSLYEKYTTLDLSFSEDRPIAIRGLEKRLLRALQTDGGHGVFNRYLHRCLLWRRSSKDLRRIKTFRGENIPSWSWMAYVGEIKYMSVPFGGVSWTEDILSPWSANEATDVGRSDNEPEDHQSTEIKAPSWEVEGNYDSGGLILDNPSRCQTQTLRYVLVGTEKSTSLDRKVYVLVVSKMIGVGEFYERVGVGIVQQSMLCHSKPPVIIRLI